MGDVKNAWDDLFGDPYAPPRTDAQGHQGAPWESNVGWENGWPDRAPGPNNPYRYAWQYEADRRTEDFRRTLFDDARGSIQQGLGLMESYRPGGSAALASGMYGQMANVSSIQAQQLQAPDVMMNIRDQQQIEASLDAQRAARFNRVLGTVATIGSIAGQVAGGSGPGAGGPQLLASTSGGAVGGAPGQAAATLPQGQTMGGMMGGPVGGSMGGGGVAPATLQGGPSGPTTGPASGPTTGAPSGPGGPQMRTGGGSGGAGGEVGAVQGAGGMNESAMAQNFGFSNMAGGLGMDGNFSPTAAAASGMRKAGPWVEHEILTEWSNSPERQKSVSMFADSARQRLMGALHG